MYFCSLGYACRVAIIGFLVVLNFTSEAHTQHYLYCLFHLHSSALLSILQRNTWDQSTEDPVSQPEMLCPGGTTPGNGSPSLGVQDSENASTYRMPTARTSGSMSSGSQPYPVQSLEEVHYPATSYTPVSNFCPPYMTVPGDLAVAKMPTMSTEENSDGTVAHSDTSTWAKDDGNGSWLSYESRRAF